MAKTAEPVVYQLKVTLDETDPPVWRRLLVPASISLKQLHGVLQKAMGWTNSHLHQFEVRDRTYGIPDPEFGENTLDEARARLDQVLTREKDTIIYEYDFGDGWIHKVALEKIAKPVEGVVVPSCIAGARACPPEDCGGVWGYQEFLQAVGDPSHPEHEEMLEWIGGPFDPESFEVTEVNKRLAPRKRRA